MSYASVEHQPCCANQILDTESISGHTINWILQENSKVKVVVPVDKQILV